MWFVRALGAVLVLFVAAGGAAAAGLPGSLVSVTWVKAHVGDPDLRVVDLSGRDDFDMRHIPDSVASDFPGIWRGPGGKVEPVATIEAGLGALGIGNGTQVVLVPAGGDATEFGIVARAYWTLKYLGHDQVAILDGGWKAWVTEAPDSSESGPTKSVAAVFKAHVRPEFLASTGNVLDQLHSATVLVDARPLEQYLGRDKSPNATRFGHIPGALTLDSGLFYDTAAGRLKPKAALAALVPPQLADPRTSLIAYCNSGWWSATDWFVLHEMLGYRSAALYVESMDGWTADPARPVETGGR